MKRISKGWRRGSSSQGTASTVTSSGADSRGSARSGGMASIAFTGSSGGRSRHHNLLMETNMAFENGSDGGRTKRSHGTGFFAFSQVGRGGGGCASLQESLTLQQLQKSCPRTRQWPTMPISCVVALVVPACSSWLVCA